MEHTIKIYKINKKTGNVLTDNTYKLSSEEICAKELENYLIDVNDEDEYDYECEIDKTEF